LVGKKKPTIPEPSIKTTLRDWVQAEKVCSARIGRGVAQSPCLGGWFGARKKEVGKGILVQREEATDIFSGRYRDKQKKTEKGGEVLFPPCKGIDGEEYHAGQKCVRKRSPQSNLPGVKGT